jgi:hypothetical protein
MGAGFDPCQDITRIKQPHGLVAIEDVIAREGLEEKTAQLAIGIMLLAMPPGEVRSAGGAMRNGSGF